MIIFLYGKDSYRIKENVDKILDGYLKKNTSGVNVYDTSEAQNPTEVAEQAIKTLGFFHEKKIILIKDIFATSYANKLSELIDYWKLAKDQGIILIVVENLNKTELVKKNKKLWEKLQNTAEINKEIEPLEGSKLATWVKSEFKTRGVEADSEAVKKLIESSTNSPDYSWKLVQEIDKLSHYVTGGKVTANDVQAMVSVETEQQIFPILDSLGERNQIKAFILLYQNLAAGMDPWYIFSMVAYQFRNLLTLKSLSQPQQTRAGQAKEALPFAEIIKRSGLNPYVARKTFDQAKHFELDELKHKFSHLAEIEIATKNGLADITDEIYGLVF